jgi:hypothetical protein
VQLDGQRPKVHSPSPPSRVRQRTSSLWVAPSPGSAAHRRLCRAPGPGWMRVGLGESCAGLPAVEALTKTDPSGGWRCFPVGCADTTGWSAKQLHSARALPVPGAPHSRPTLCMVAADHPDVKGPASMSAHALTHGVLRLVAAVLGPTKPEPSSAFADALKSKEGS